jgi:hypothetical protein
MEGVLKMVDLETGKGFRLAQGFEKRERGGVEEEEALIERPWTGTTEPWRSSQQQEIDRAEAIRKSSSHAKLPNWLIIDRPGNSEAYAAMTRGAIPLVPAPGDDAIETPSRKRRRMLAVAASDSGSSFDPMSPQRHANSTPRRPAKRLCSNTPLSESRRRSAPSRLFSPLKPRSLGEVAGLGDTRQMLFDEEVRHTLCKDEEKVMDIL